MLLLINSKKKACENIEEKKFFARKIELKYLETEERKENRKIDYLSDKVIENFVYKLNDNTNTNIDDIFNEIESRVEKFLNDKYAQYKRQKRRTRSAR